MNGNEKQRNNIMENQPKKLNIVLLTDCLGTLTGGAERQMFELVRRLDKQKYAVTIVSLEMDGEAPRELLESAGCRLKTVPIKRIYDFEGIRQGFAFVRFLKKEKADILMTYHFASDIWGTAFAKMAGVPVIISNRRDMGFWRNKKHVRAYKLVNRWVSKIVVVAEEVKNLIEHEEKVLSNKITVISNGVELPVKATSEEKKHLQSELNITDDDFVIVHVANLKPVKGHEYLLKAVAKLAEQNANVKLVLIGADQLNGELQQLAQSLKIEQQVLFLGERQDARRLLTLADVCVLPSLSEGMSNAILEYMAAGKPVVATSVGGNPELIEDGLNGLLVEKENPRALYEALNGLMQNRKQRELMGQRSLQNVKDRFTIDRMLESYERLFRQMSPHRKRILHLISSGGFFGAEQIVLQLTKNLNHNGIASIVGALNNRRNPHLEVVNKAQEEGLQTFVVDCHGRFDIRTIYRLAKYIRKNRINLLHTHNYKSNFIGLMAAKLTGTPIVATAHGYTGVSQAVSMYEKFDRFILKYFFRRVILVTNNVFTELSFRKKIIIHNGIDIGRFTQQPEQRELARKHYNIGKNDVVIGTVGRLSREKNQRLLLDVAENIIRKFHNVKFMIVGDGPEEDSLKERTQSRGISGHVIFTGLLKDVVPAYQAMDIFSLPSKTEGIPLAVLEAMASRRPIVASRVGGVPKLIKDNDTGLLVQSNDISDFMRKLEFLIMNRHRWAQLSESAHEYLKLHYSNEQMVAAYQKVYEEVLV